MDHYDVIVVGAGSSGGVIAARLTENASRRVLLLDAGPDFPQEETVPPLFTFSGEHHWRGAAGIPEFDWDFVNTDGAGTLAGRSLRVPRGRLVGGTSMINATIAARGAPFDFDRWAAMGNNGWAWADVLPLFIAIENDVNFADDPIHGRDGPIVVQRYRPQSWAPVNRTMYDACLELGVREAPDLNALDAQAGVIGPMPHNRYKEVRQGTLVTYLRAARPRPNLAIRGGCHVDRIILEIVRAKGVVFIDSGGQRQMAYGDEVVISAGVYNSPAILQRSGVGPAEWLRPLGIDVVSDLAVGRNLTDHPGFPMLFRAEGLGVTTGRFFAANVRGPANAAGEPEWQTHPFPVDEEEHTAGFWTYLTRQEATGEVRIQSTEPVRPPHIDHRYNTRQRDQDRFADARSFVKAMLATRAFQSHRAVSIDDLDKPIAVALSEAMGPAHHQAGSVKMGPAGDRTAVVGPDLRIHGFDNLRVADTSIYPDNVMHNTNLTAIVVGEMAARLIDNIPAGAGGSPRKAQAHS
jgi:choline dehydrogenase